MLRLMLLNRSFWRERQRLAPHKCYTTAKALLATLQEKWNPLKKRYQDGLTPTQNRRRENEPARERVRERDFQLFGSHK